MPLPSLRYDDDERAALVLGVGLGAFADGIVLHQVLQWHHMLSSTHWSTHTVAGLEANTLADGLFHVVALAITLAGVTLLWRAQDQAPRRLAWRGLIGPILLGWGLFNLVEGVVDHLLLGIHHVREGSSATAWDLTFLVVAVALIVLGEAVRRSAASGATPSRAR